MKIKAMSIAILCSFALVGCGETVSDRESGAGKEADDYADTSKVKVYRNADDVPNVAFFCTEDYGWVSTLSGAGDGSSKSASLTRFKEYDEVCSGASNDLPAPAPE